MAKQEDETQVIIVGFGPTGALLSAYLCLYAVPHIVLERELEIARDPRGIVLDEDGIRSVQGLGRETYQRLWTEVGTTFGIIRFISGIQTDLHQSPFMLIDNDPIGATCHPHMMAQAQPKLEKCIRDAIYASPIADVRLGSTVVAIQEDDEFVHVEYLSAMGMRTQVKSRFLVGCDGKTGFVRKQYLEPRGILAERNPKFAYEELWVAMNFHITLPTRSSHPDFPLFSKGFTPEEIYETFFPPDFRFICNPNRAAVCGRFGLKDDRTLRFEFKVNPDEDSNEMAKTGFEKVALPYFTHDGRKYGLRGDVAFPRDCIEVLRSSAYSFTARSCTKWALDRTILAGDAAHVFPPYGGQGISSGMRDSIGLAWRLALLTSPAPPQYTDILEAWYLERKQQYEYSLAKTIKNGQAVNEKSYLRIFFRNWLLYCMQSLPEIVRPDMNPRPLTRYRQNSDKNRAKFPFLEDMGGGRLIPQVYCSNAPRGQRLFTDDVIFARESRGLFRLLVAVDTFEDAEAAKEAISNLTIKETLLCPRDATYLVCSPETRNSTMENTYLVVHKEEFEPSKQEQMRGYDGALLKREIRGGFVIVRPDRFIFAACQDIKELTSAVEALEDMFKART